MPHTGSCLCGGVRFTVERVTGPFELCHCPRCRKASGAAFVAGLTARIEDYSLLAGADLIRTCVLPVRERPPGYTTAFCARCGSPVPNPEGDTGEFELPAGLLDDDPGVRPDKHIFVECKAPWFEISDALPRFDKPGLAEHRRREASRRR